MREALRSPVSHLPSPIFPHPVSAYCDQSAITAVIPAPTLTDALDDDRDGVADDGLLDTIIAQASQSVDAYLSGLYTTPFADPVPAPVAEAATVFACEMIYDRRPVANNPFKAAADAWRTRLQAIAKREQNLDANVPLANAPGAAITECVQLNSNTR